MINCWRTKQLLAGYIDGELSPSDTTLVEEHLEGCPECAELTRRLAELPPLDLPRLAPDEERAVWSRLDEALEDAWRRREEASRRDTFGRAAWSTVRGWLDAHRLAIPLPAAAAYLLLIVALTGWNLVTYQRVHSLSQRLHETSGTAAAAADQDAPAPATGLTSSGFTAAMPMPLDPVSNRALEIEEITPLPHSVPVVDPATGEVIYHTVDHGYPIGY